MPTNGTFLCHVRQGFSLRPKLPINACRTFGQLDQKFYSHNDTHIIFSFSRITVSNYIRNIVYYHNSKKANPFQIGSVLSLSTPFLFLYCPASLYECAVALEYVRCTCIIRTDSPFSYLNTIVCKRRRQTLVSDETSCISSIPP